MGMFRGEVAALAAAGLWAFATLLFGRLGKQLSPPVLNLVKGGVAIALILLTLLVRQQLIAQLPNSAMVLLLISGVVGIGLGDTAYFATINDLGPRRALLMETLAPPLSALFALATIGERLSGIAWLGIGITLAGVAWVVGERAAAGEVRHLRRGLVLGTLAATGQAAGAVLSRAALAGTDIDPLWSTLLRLLAGLLCLGLIVIARSNLRQGLEPLRSGRLLAGVAVAAFFGTYLALWLQQTAFKFAETGVAQALLATSPVFVLPMAAIAGARITGRAVVGALIASGGVCLLFWG